MGTIPEDKVAGDEVLFSELNLLRDIGFIIMNAGETLNGGTLPVPVYKDPSDNELYACDANVTTKLNFAGFVISNSTDGNPIQFQGTGVVGGFSGLTAGEDYYVQDAVGTIGTSKGTNEVLVGRAVSTTQIYIKKRIFPIAHEEILASDNLAASEDGELFTSSSSPPVLLTTPITVFKGGTIRVEFDTRDSGATSGNDFAVYINGVQKGTLRAPLGTYITYTEDFSVRAGDIISVYYHSGAFSGTKYVRNFRIYFDDLIHTYEIN